MTAHRFRRAPNCRTVATTLIALSIVIAALSGCSATAGHPPIDSLVSNYRTHRAQFQKLVAMVSTDPHFAVALSGKHAYSQDLPSARVARYGSLLNALGASDLEWDGYEIGVGMGSSGLAVGGESWDYIRADQPPASVVTLEKARLDPSGSWCVPLGGRWYVQLDRG